MSRTWKQLAEAAADVLNEVSDAHASTEARRGTMGTLGEIETEIRAKIAEES